MYHIVQLITFWWTIISQGYIFAIEHTNHSRSQSFNPFGQWQGLRALVGSNLQSANRGLPVRLRSLKWKTPKVTIADQAKVDLFHSHLQLKEKQ